MDWFEVLKIAPGFIGAATGCTAIYLNRRDARKAAEATYPRVTAHLNPNQTREGLYVIKLTFTNVGQPFRFDRAEIRSPRGAVIARYNTQKLETPAFSRALDVPWKVDPPTNQTAAAGTAHLYLKLLPEETYPSEVALRFQGRFLSGMQKPIAIAAIGKI